MQLKAFEKTDDTLTFRWTTKGYGWAGFAFFVMALTMPQIFVMFSRLVMYVVSGISVLAGIVCFYIGGVHTHIIDRTTKTFSRHIRGRLRNTTHTWQFQDIKDIIIISKIFSTRSGPGYYEYWTCVALNTDKKIKLNKQRDKAKSEQISEMLKRYIFI